MNDIEWWAALQTLGRGFLALLSVLTQWPVMLLAALVFVISVFRTPLTWLIQNSRWSAAAKGVTITVEPQQPIPVDLAAKDPAAEEAALQPDAVHDIQAIHADAIADTAINAQMQAELRAQVAQLTIERDAALEASWDFYYRWMMTQLTERTQAALQYVAKAPGIPVPFLQQELTKLTNSGEAAAVELALHNAGFIETRNGAFFASDKGQRFLDWRAAKGLEPLKPLYLYPYQSIPPSD